MPLINAGFPTTTRKEALPCNHLVSREKGAGRGEGGREGIYEDRGKGEGEGGEAEREGRAEGRGRKRHGVERGGREGRGRRRGGSKGRRDVYNAMELLINVLLNF